MKQSGPFIARQTSSLTGEALLNRLEAVGWTGSDFTWFVGVTGRTVYRYLQAQRRIPMSIQRLLEYVESNPSGLKRVVDQVAQYRPKGDRVVDYDIPGQESALTGEALFERLAAVGWSGSDFARFTGVTGMTMYRYRAGLHRIPMSMQRLLEYVESDPLRLMTLPEMDTPKSHHRSRQVALAVQRHHGDHPENHAAEMEVAGLHE